MAAAYSRRYFISDVSIFYRWRAVFLVLYNLCEKCRTGGCVSVTVNMVLSCILPYEFLSKRETARNLFFQMFLACQKLPSVIKT